jgi:hypothetical protein
MGTAAAVSSRTEPGTTEHEPLDRCPNGRTPSNDVYLSAPPLTLYR